MLIYNLAQASTLTRHYRDRATVSVQRLPNLKARAGFSSSGPGRTGIVEDHRLRRKRSVFPYGNGGRRLTRVEPGEHLAQLRVLLNELLCKLMP